MGRKRRLPARAREKLVGEEVATAMEVDQKEGVLQARPDDALFVVDTVGSGRKRHKLQKEAKAAKFISKNEKKLVVHKYLGKGKPNPAQRKRISDPWGEDNKEEELEGAQAVVEMSKKTKNAALALLPAAEGAGTGDAETLVVKRKGGAAGSGAGAGVGDGGDDFVTSPVKPGKNAKRPKPKTKDLAKLGVCHPGQSYNPTEDDHDDVLASAIAVELKRQEAVEDEQRPLAMGMSKETLALMTGEDEGDESSDEEDDGREILSLGKPTPATGKLTRAQRNKQKRVKEAKYELAVRRQKKAMTKSIDQVTALQKSVAEQEVLREERRQTKRLIKAQKAKLAADGAAGDSLFGPSAGVAAMGMKRQRNKDVILGRSVPVNLGEELHGSLRQLKAQGSVLLDKVELLKASKAHPDRRKGKERAKKTHKGFKKKHTYKDRYKDD